MENITANTDSHAHSKADLRRARWERRQAIRNGTPVPAEYVWYQRSALEEAIELVDEGRAVYAEMKIRNCLLNAEHTVAAKLARSLLVSCNGTWAPNEDALSALISSLSKEQSIVCDLKFEFRSQDLAQTKAQALARLRSIALTKKRFYFCREAMQVTSGIYEVYRLVGGCPEVNEWVRTIAAGGDQCATRAAVTHEEICSLFIVGDDPLRSKIVTRAANAFGKIVRRCVPPHEHYKFADIMIRWGGNWMVDALVPHEKIQG
jgi:hypothetical protein